MKHKLVVVDDDEQMLALLTRVFDPQYEVFTANDGHSGLELIKKENPFLVFLDVNMPELSGIEVLEGIKKLGLPAIVWMLTVDHNIDMAKKAFEHGAAGYVTKPFALDTIINIVQNAAQAGKE